MSKLDDILNEFFVRNSDGSVLQDEIDLAKKDVKDLMLEIAKPYMQDYLDDWAKFVKKVEEL